MDGDSPLDYLHVIRTVLEVGADEDVSAALLEERSGEVVRRIEKLHEPRTGFQVLGRLAADAGAVLSPEHHQLVIEAIGEGLVRAESEGWSDPALRRKALRDLAKALGCEDIGMFRLSTGFLFDLLAPDPRLITPEVIATGLGNTCRYGGQIDPFYSVAEHSVIVSELVPPMFERAALLHDASEGLGLSDVISPLKVMLPQYLRIERTVMRAVALAFGLEEGFEHLPAVRLADRLVFRLERSTGLQGSQFRRWSSAAAREGFRQRFEELKA